MEHRTKTEPTPLLQYLCKEMGSGDKAVQGGANKNNQTSKWLEKRGIVDTKLDQGFPVDSCQESRTGDTKSIIGHSSSTRWRDK